MRQIEENDWEDCETVETKEIGEEVFPCFGVDYIGVTREQVNDLLNGKVLYGQVQDAEYAFVLRLVEQK
jgi:hypothetical protein